MNGAGTVRLSQGSDGVASVRWARPEVANAFDERLVDDVLETLHGLVAAPPRVLVLSGQDNRFSAGFDLSGTLDDRVLAWRFARAEELLQAIRSFPAVTVACVTGPAFGMGADIVTSCDYRLGDARSRFRFPGPRFGVVLGTHQLRARVGTLRATDILLRNEVVDSQAAVRDGLLTHLLEGPEQGRFVADLAGQIQGLDAQTLRSLLRILRTDDADASVAGLTRSTHRAGLAARIAGYRDAALSRPTTTG